MKTDPNAPVVTEEDLMKSIQALETPAEVVAAPVAEPVIQTAELAKTASQHVAAVASEELKKTINASTAFAEFTQLMGEHIDSSLQSMSKSLQSAAERDMGIVKVLTDLKKSIDANTAMLKTYGEAPTHKSAVTTLESEILVKSAPATIAPKATPEQMRKQIAQGLESMVKSAGHGTPEASALISAAIRYEATGEIDDLTLRKVQAHYA